MGQINDADEYRAEVWGGVLGLWGIISGLALFLTWDAFWRTHHWWVVPLELALAVLAAFIAERARERVETPAERATSIFTSVLILVVLEFFVLGWSGIPSLAMGNLRDISRRILGEGSQARPAKFYVFDLRRPDDFQLQLTFTDSVLSNPNEKERRAQREQWVQVNFRPHFDIHGFPQTPPPLTPQETEALVKSEVSRENVAYRILQLLTPEDRRLTLDQRAAESVRDGALVKALNAAVDSADFYRAFYPVHKKDGSGLEEQPPLPPEPEMKRLNRRVIEQAFPGMILRMPEESRTEWADLALGAAPLLIIGIYFGVCMVMFVADMREEKPPKTGMRKLTLVGLYMGAGVGFFGAFIGFFAYVFLVRLGYYVISHHVFASLRHIVGFVTFDEFKRCMGPAFRSALMFVVPGATLGAIMPWLRPPSRSPKFWSAIASIAAALSLLASLLSHSPCWWIAVGCLLALSILWYIHKGKAIEWYWTTAGFVVALFLCAVTVTAQATLGSVFKEAHLFIQRPDHSLTEFLEKYRVVTGPKGDEPVPMDAAELRRYEESGVKAEYKDDWARQQEETRTVGQALEVFVMGGLGFWVSIAALAAWKLLDDRPGEVPAEKEARAGT